MCSRVPWSYPRIDNPCGGRLDCAHALVIVDLTVTGITSAEASARKFAIDPQPGSMAYFEPTAQTVYSLSGAQLSTTVHPAVVWGVNAGTPLDDGDMGAHLGVTYTVVAESLDGLTASPIATQTSFESFAGVTSVPGQNVTPPPTASAPRSSSDGSAPISATGDLQVTFRTRPDRHPIPAPTRSTLDPCPYARTDRRCTSGRLLAAAQRYIDDRYRANARAA
jgi:hypothetical protein